MMSMAAYVEEFVEFAIMNTFIQVREANDSDKPDIRDILSVKFEQSRLELNIVTDEANLAEAYPEDASVVKEGCERRRR